MQFHEYVTSRNRTAQHHLGEKEREHAKSMSSDEYRDFMLEFANWNIKENKDKMPIHVLKDFIHMRDISAFEIDWVAAERPFYNVWPIALEVCKNVSIDVPLRDIPGVGSILLRFPRGREPCGITTASVSKIKNDPNDDFFITTIIARFEDPNRFLGNSFFSDKEITAEEFIKEGWEKEVS